jgi:hypothetical protein
MGEWYRVTKRIRGTPYLYLQRIRRIDGRVVTENRYLGRSDARGVPRIRKKPEGGGGVHAAAMAVFGVEDEFGEQVNSLWNQYVNIERPVHDNEEKQSRAPGNNDESSASENPSEHEIESEP